jgi:hypothetical protein
MIISQTQIIQKIWMNNVINLKELDPSDELFFIENYVHLVFFFYV